MKSFEAAFWQTLDHLVTTSQRVLDRPRGTTHPRYPELIYPLDYGYLAGTTAADGDGIDIWVGSLPEPQLMGVICTVDRVKRDAELKLLLGCTPEEAESALAFHHGDGQAGLLILRARPTAANTPA